MRYLFVTNILLVLLLISITASCSGKSGISPITPTPIRSTTSDYGSITIMLLPDDNVSISTSSFMSDMVFIWDDGLIITNNGPTVYDFTLNKGDESYVFGIIEQYMVTSALDLPLEPDANTYTISLEENPQITLNGEYIQPSSFNNENIAVTPDGFEYVNNEVIFGFAENTPDHVRHQVIQNHNLFLVGYCSGLEMYVCRFYDGRDPFNVVDELSLESSVQLPEVNVVVSATYFPSDTAWDPVNGELYNWAMQRIMAKDAWDFYKDGVIDQSGNATIDNVALCIADSGVKYYHEDIVNDWDREFVFNSYSKNFIDPKNPFDYDDRLGHGTMVTGIAAAQGNNNVGLAGVIWNPYLISLKCLNDYGKGTAASIAWSIKYIGDLAGMYPEIKFIGNFSLGTKSVTNNWLELATNYTNNNFNNTLLIGAAGNQGQETPFYPASYDAFMSVGASSDKVPYNDNGILKDWEVEDECIGYGVWGTNWHPTVDVCAPGSMEIFTTSFPENRIFPIESDICPKECPDYYCKYFGGTSAAAPHVSGLAALLWGKYPLKTKQEIKDRIIYTGDPMYLEEKQGYLGNPGTERINAYRALPKGYPIWAVPEGGSGEDIGHGITSLSDDSIVITGRIANKDIFIARYSDETLRWRRQIMCETPTHLVWEQSCGYGITTLSDDSVVVTGHFFGANIDFGSGIILSSKGDDDMFVAKYDSNGTAVWAKSAGGVSAYGIGRAITTLSDDSVVVAGILTGEVTFGEGEEHETVLASNIWAHDEEGKPVYDSDVFVAKYIWNGMLEWAKVILGDGWDEEEQKEADAWDQSQAITTLSNDSVVLTGYFGDKIAFGQFELVSDRTNPPPDNIPDDIFIACCSSSGIWNWAKRAGGTSFDHGHGITSCSDNSVVVTGYYFGTAYFDGIQLTAVGNYDIFIARYNSSGTAVWAKSAGGFYPDQGFGITSLSDNSTVLTGCFKSAATFGKNEPNQTVLTSAGSRNDIIIARYNPDGTLFWAKRAGGPGHDGGSEITALSDNSTAITGVLNYEGISTGTAIFGEGEWTGSMSIVSTDQDIFIARYAP